MTGQSLKQAIAWVLIAILAMTLAATMLALAVPDMAQAVSDTSQKVGDEAKGWLTVLFLVVAGFAALPVIGRLDVGRGLALAALVLILGGLAFAQGDVRSAIHSIWSSIGRAVEESGRVVIRSFRLVFDRGYRRLFKIDRYRLPFAYGLPILGIIYAAAAALALALAARLPGLGAALGALPAPIHWVALPAALAMAMLHWRPDGLKPHIALWTWLDALVTVEDLAGWERAEHDGDALALGALTCAPDGRGPRYRPGRVEGPAQVLLRYPARGWQRGRRLHVEQTSDQPLDVGTQVTLRAGEQLVFEAAER